MLSRRAALMVGAGLVAAPMLVKTAAAEGSMDTSAAAPVDLSTLQRIRHELVAPPFVHEHEQVASTGPRIVEFTMDIKEMEIQVAEDAWLQAMTFNGSVPGPMMVVHEGRGSGWG